MPDGVAPETSNFCCLPAEPGKLPLWFRYRAVNALLPTSLVRLPQSAQYRVNAGTLASDC
jgi:hypothetical protein